MKQKTQHKTALFISTFILSGARFAAPIDKEALAVECKFLGSSLSIVAKANTKEYCSVDVSYSGKVMGQASSLITVNHIQLAMENLFLVYRTLKRIEGNNRDCNYFAHLVRPYIDKTEVLLSQSNSIPHPSIN